MTRLLLLAVACLALCADQAPRVQLDQLAASPGRYNGKQVIVIAEVYSGPEMTVIHLPSATGEPRPPQLMLVTVADSTSRKPGRLERQFLKMLKRSGEAHATLQGRFDSSETRVWGHEACCKFRLVIDRVIDLR